MHEFINTFPRNWEQQLEYALLTWRQGPATRRAYICSPCRANQPQGIYRNMRAARFYMYCAHERLRVLPCALHAYLPPMLSDHRTIERVIALQAGQKLLEISDMLFVCGDALTQGMRQEVQYAATLGVRIVVFCPDLLLEVSKTVTRAGEDRHLVECNYSVPYLGTPPDELFPLEEVR